MDASAEGAKIDDETGDHYTGDELGEPDMTSISFKNAHMLQRTHTLHRQPLDLPLHSKDESVSGVCIVQLRTHHTRYKTTFSKFALKIHRK
jgi:hypothetical protein